MYKTIFDIKSYIPQPYCNPSVFKGGGASSFPLIWLLTSGSCVF